MFEKSKKLFIVKIFEIIEIILNLDRILKMSIFLYSKHILNLNPNVIWSYMGWVSSIIYGLQIFWVWLNQPGLHNVKKYFKIRKLVFSAKIYLGSVETFKTFKWNLAYMIDLHREKVCP
jgi:hypothetical protein